MKMHTLRSFGIKAASLTLALSMICTGVRAAASDDDARTALESSVGTLSAQNLLLTYVALGTMADAYAKKSYKKEDATQVLDSCKQTIEVAQGSLKKLLDGDVLRGEADVTYVKQCIKAFDLLSDEAEAFQRCIRDDDKESVDAFVQRKDAAWKTISEILGIK